MRESRSAIIAVAIISSLASAAEIDAAELPQRLRAGDYELMLNGSGARYKSLLKLYVSGLYLTDSSSDAASIISAKDPMAIRIQITSMFVSQEKMVAALNEGFEKSTTGNLGPISNEVRQFRECFAEKISKGDVFDMVYLPSRGVVVVKNGRQKGVIQGDAFKQAMFGIWLSDRPADARLKQAMLGN